MIVVSTILNDKIMRAKRIFPVTIILSGLFLASCDPVYPILITNSNKDTVTVITETTIHFQPLDTLVDYRELSGPYNHRIIQFKIAPMDTLECGMAIAGIENEMPFTKFSIYAGQDSIIADTQTEILELFAKSFWGKLKTPYELVIK